MIKFKGIIFDLDGTLVNSLEDIADSMNMVLRDYNFPVHDLQTYKQFVGGGIRHLIYKALPETEKKEALIERCYNSMIEIYRNNCMNKTRPYGGIDELLDELVSRNMKLAVFSNKADEFTKKIVPALLPKWKFAAIIGLSSEEHKKPNPLIPLQISDIFKIGPDDIIYVGDSGVDMQTANNAGMYAVGALWGFQGPEALLSNGAKHLLNHPLDLINLL